ncbi:MAG: hypothetical protein KF863_20435 [Rubrivivax sp.]|nr:hypothetical protein [Rubrivivax sp.]
MDILAHTLWAGVGAAWLALRRRDVTRRTVAATMALAALPDVIQMLPVLAWWAVGGGTWDAVQAFAIAMPGQEPVMPGWVTVWSHTIHCIAHSAVIVAGVTLVLWAWRRTLWLPLLGWWSHIVIDVFTHSADYYASPVLYPVTERGFDGIAWITPWFIALNYLALAMAGVALLVSARQRSGSGAVRPPDGPKRSST